MGRIGGGDILLHPLLNSRLCLFWCTRRVVKGLKLSKEELGQELLPEVRGRGGWGDQTVRERRGTRPCGPRGGGRP